MHSIHDALTWRFATHAFDTAKKVSDTDIDAIAEAGNLMPTAYGLQPFRIISIADDAKKAKLLEATYGQTNYVENSHLFVLAIRTDIDAAMISEYARRIETTRGFSEGSASAFEDMMLGDITNRPQDSLPAWATKQAYLALGGMIAEASLLGIDSHVAEVFMPDAYDEMLGLREKNLHTVVIMAVGYRAASPLDEQRKSAVKVRVPKEEMHIKL